MTSQTTMKVEKYPILAATLGGESSLPNIVGMTNTQQKTKTILDEDDELFIGYGFLDNCFPYRLQDQYERELKPTELDSVVLENEHLKAIFLPEYGGRLWSLYDKDAERELLFKNPVIRPGNLAVRSAWLSGGVEWNLGMVGHHPYTCSRLFTAKLTMPDGTPVLRMYEYERIRGVIYQMDFFLPTDSKMLFTRMRIVNPTTNVVPMYWWSNIAVPELKDGRVVMSTNETYTNRDNMVSKTTVPISNGIDITYPTNNPFAIDFFWKIPKENRKYVCQLDGKGYGLIQTSTKRLKGRKLFVWGQGPGGDRWQEFLSADGQDGRYVEIQAGLASTQYECLPMPPKTAWEWLEAYGPMQADGQKVHGDWEEAKAEVEARLQEIITSEKMEELLAETRESIALQDAELLYKGSGWGALEEKRRELEGEVPMCGHLDFGQIEEEQEPWSALLEKGSFGRRDTNASPVSWMLQDEWTHKLEKAVTEGDEFNWYTWLQLGMVYFEQKQFDKSYQALERSMTLQPSSWALYGLGQLAYIEGHKEKAAMKVWQAATMLPDDVSLAKEAARMLLEVKKYREVIQFIQEAPMHIGSVARIKLYMAFAYLGIEEINKAEEILHADNGLCVADIREGENSITDLWFQIEELKAQKEGRSFDKETILPPKHFDFRMNAIKVEE